MVKTKELLNGVKLVYENIPYLRSISFGIWVKNGSRNEEIENSGISHFIEHMLFKGTEKRTAKNIADELDVIGGQMNAFTTKEYTCYYTRTLDTHFNIVIDVLSDMFFNSKFSEVEIQKERGVILEEIDMYEDSPEELVHDLLQNKIWGSNQLGSPIIGFKDTISTFNQNRLKSYFDKNYTSDNIVISVAGNFQEEQLIERVTHYFGGMKNINNNNKIEKANYTPSFVSKEKDVEQVHLLMGFKGLDIHSKDFYTLTLINTLFGGGLSSKLFQKIREENGLAYSVYSYNSSYTKEGIYGIYAGLSPDNIEKTADLVLQEVKKLCLEGITKDELKNTKEQIKSNYLLSLESTSNRMSNIGRNMLLGIKILTQDEVVAKVDKITLEDIERVSNSVLNIDKLSISIVGNIKKVNLKYLSDLVRG